MGDFLSDDELDNHVFRLHPDVSDDELDQVMEALHGEGPQFRSEETEPTAEMLGELVGDPEWAAGFSRSLSQLDAGSHGLLEPEEERILLRSVNDFSDGRGFTIDELHAVRQWANQVKLSMTLLELVLDGQLLVGWDPTAGGAVFVLGPNADAL